MVLANDRAINVHIDQCNFTLLTSIKLKNAMGMLRAYTLCDGLSPRT
jgi:hypothetical protein